MSNVIVTSMSQKYWNMSGLTWLNSIKRYNPNVTPYIVSEDMKESLYIHTIENIREYNDFIKTATIKEVECDPTNYRWQARRFCHKVFAINQAFTNIAVFIIL